MEKETALVKSEGFDLPSKTEVETSLAKIQEFQVLVKTLLKEGHDFGTIPGTNKPTLLKPGSEKIAKLLGLACSYEIMEKIEDWDRPLFAYTIRCVLTQIGTGALVDQGIGECNSYESKYRYRTPQRVCPECGKEAILKGKDDFGGGWLCWNRKGGCGAKWPDGDQSIEGQSTEKILNDDPFSLINTFLKMAKKRALVDAALSVGRLSDIFTQDLDELPRNAEDSQVIDVESRSGGQSNGTTSSYFCDVHQTPWFKRGKMKGYAHPLGDNEPWCDMGERQLANNSAGPQDPNGTLVDMGDVMRRASKEFDLNLKDVLRILEVEDTLVNWKGSPDEAWDSVQKWYAEQNSEPEESPAS